MNLVELVEANRRGRTNAQIAVDAGDSIPDRNYLPGLAKISTIPTVLKIHGIARALEVSPATVLAAAAEQLGLGQLQPGEDTDPALLGAQARADRLQAELGTEREEVRTLKRRISALQATRQKKKADAKQQRQTASITDPNSSGAHATSAELDSEAMYWREHALRYRARLARYEGLHPFSPRHINQTLQNLANSIN